MYNSPHIHARDGNSDSSGKLSTSTIVVIVVVCGAVVVLALILFLWRFLFRLCSRKKPNPLPPVQLLAHQRQEQVAALAERKTFYEADSFRGSTYKPPLHQTPSYASLLPGSSISSRQNSVHVDHATSADSLSALGPPVSMNGLIPPNPLFNPHASTSSVNSSSDGVSPSSSVPFSDTASYVSHVTSASGHRLSSRPGGRSVPRSQSRPVSLASSVGTMQTFQSSRGSIIRGAPHSRLSNIQIVLPAPLAPQTYPFHPADVGMDRMSGSYILGGTGEDESAGQSVFVDRWVPVGTRSMSASNIHTGPPSARPSSSTNPRIRSSLSQSTTAPLPQQAYRRSQSQPRLSGPRSSQGALSHQMPMPHQSPPPPVPQLPSEFSRFSQAVVYEEVEPVRGRSRSSTIVRSAPLPHARISGESNGGGPHMFAPMQAPTPTAVPESADHLPPPRPPDKRARRQSESRSRRNTLQKPRGYAS